MRFSCHHNTPVNFRLVVILLSILNVSCRRSTALVEEETADFTAIEIHVLFVNLCFFV